MANRVDLVAGIVLIVLGVLVLTGNLAAPVGWLLWIAGVCLVIIGALMLIRRIPGGPLMGAIAIVLGAILLVPELDVIPSAVNDVVHVIIGVVLLVVGVLKVMGKQ